MQQPQQHHKMHPPRHTSESVEGELNNRKFNSQVFNGQVYNSQVPNTQVPNSQANLGKSTYANVAMLSSLPEREEAIVIDLIEGLTNDDYIDGLEKMIDMKDKRAISKIFGARVCVYLSNEDLVSQLKNKVIEVKNYSFKPLNDNNRRVVISNIHPDIPHGSMNEAMRKVGINIVSNVNYIRAALTKTGRAHILSFRRQFYVKEEDEFRVPESTQVSFGNSHNWCYLSTESIIRFICKQNGHIAKSCSNANVKTDETIAPNINTSETEKTDAQQVGESTNTKRPYSISDSEKSVEIRASQNMVPDLPPIFESEIQVDAKEEATEISKPEKPTKKKNSSCARLLATETILDKNSHLFSL
ncbi:hypothetical protein QAD02_016297 [Eretmocerus hayati]|uniref:Uncharacterized protein n=1 Tax=Eretmocerus hayati TaxID=131215 RepID=A0ACC2PAT0_9HYME|nr:hypothetical protein QAD02_016297 [Eretmocerus hayati]